MNKDFVIDRLKKLEPRLREHGVEALFLFGSFARDEGREDSDIDLLADFVEGRDSDIMAFLAPYEDLENAFPGREIGFSTRDRLVPSYRASIEANAIQVF